MARIAWPGRWNRPHEHLNPSWAAVPAPLDDCYSALAWLHNEAERLDIDRAQIAIGGESAGGGLAAALAIRARMSVCHQQTT